MTLNKRFAIVKLWDTKCAEDENIQRFVETSKELGIECIPVDKNYRYLSDKKKIATEKDFDFILHLHFESLKINNLFSFVTLWNPTEFYHDWDYRRYSNNLLTHDDFLTSCAVGAEHHLRRILYKDNFHLFPRFELFPASSEHIFPPERRTNRKLHYCGINWEKATGKKSRHSDLLFQLDKKNKINIYGPERLGNIRLWDGFSCYRGELPFDGHSMIRTIHESGVSLVLSSPAHIESQLMSNRLFEALAAGSNIICDENSFIKTYMGDLALYVDSKMPPKELSLTVENYLDWFNANPEKAYEMAKRGQEIFNDHFNLKSKIIYIYDNLESRKKELQNQFLLKYPRKAHVCFLCVDEKYSISNVVESIHSNMSENIFFHIYCHVKIKNVFKKYFSGTPNIIINEFVEDTIGKHGEIHYGKNITHFLDAIDDSSYFTIVMPNEILRHNHITSLLKTIELENCDAAYSNRILIFEEKDKNKKNDNVYLTEDCFDRDYSVISSGNFIFCKKNFKDTYRFFLYDIKCFVVGYFYLLSSKICSTHAYTFQLEHKKHYMFKLDDDVNVLKDLKPESNLELLGKTMEIPFSPVSFPWLVTKLAKTVKPLIKILPGYDALKKYYHNFERKYSTKKFVKITIKQR